MKDEQLMAIENDSLITVETESATCGLKTFQTIFALFERNLNFDVELIN
jgi:hypothetical protein